MTTPWLIGGAVTVLMVLLGYALLWIVIDGRERRKYAHLRRARADAAVALHRAHQHGGRYLTDDPRRPE